MLPFTTAQGFPLFAAYALGIVALVSAMRSGASAGRIVAAALAAMGLWSGTAHRI